MNPIATPKPDFREKRREEGIAKLWLYEQKPDIKAFMADEMTVDIKVPKGNRNPWV